MHKLCFVIIKSLWRNGNPQPIFRSSIGVIRWAVQRNLQAKVAACLTASLIFFSSALPVTSSLRGGQQTASHPSLLLSLRPAAGHVWVGKGRDWKRKCEGKEKTNSVERRSCLGCRLTIPAECVAPKRGVKTEKRREKRIAEVSWRRTKWKTC